MAQQPTVDEISDAYQACMPYRKNISGTVSRDPNLAGYKGDMADACAKIEKEWQNSAAARAQRETEKKAENDKAKISDTVKRLGGK